ncbi:venom serine carboxypeptidase [Bicyclus anynana]|uniref:Carboxypeptidase n=1 Tax=Bicyclus anynana TaxID=110368 RepID=A0ABM3M745_BICAN|nr:venom serine carboxypeptidase [Bicyclus anynana]
MYFLREIALFTTLIYIATTVAATPALILTQLIKQNKLQEAKNASTVDPNKFLNFTSYSGFLTVDERYNSNLFFWYFPVSKDLAKTPWIIWLQGGPGATSLAGLFSEIGPFKYDINRKELKKRESSWCDEYSMVFIDNPVGAGFSFTDKDEGFVRNMEMYTDNLYRAVQQLVQVYPELGKAPLYIAGESYAGRYVPALATKILEENHQAKHPINLQGLIMGNPVTDRSSIVDFTQMFYNWGLVDEQGAAAARSLQEEYQHAINKGDNVLAHDLREKLYDKLQDIAYQNQLYNVLHDAKGLTDFSEWVTRPDIAEAIHVGGIAFTFSNQTVHTKLLPDFLSPVTPKIDVLLENYKVLIYCGQLDLTAPCVPSAAARRRDWRWSGRGAFLNAPRVPWWFNGTVAGYVKSGGNFTEIQVNGAGHLVPLDKPTQAKQIVHNFISGQVFSTPPDYRLLDPNPKYQDYSDLRTSEVLSNASEVKNGLIVSVVLNVLLLVGIVVGGIMTMRWKREHDYYNLPLSDNISDDHILTFA